jgi:hypothetical protein
LLAGFAPGGGWDARVPGPDLAAALAAAAGPEWRCKDASGPELIGILRRLAALEAWAAAGRLGVIRALIRADDPACLAGSRHRDLPDAWDESLTREIALALAASPPATEKTMRAAWELGARLPEINALLETSVIDLAKARMITEVFADLTDEDAAAAEEMLVRDLTTPPAKTYAQVEQAAVTIALTIDPRSAERRRKAAEKHAARVQMFRERAGTAALSGRDLPTDQTLAAYANVNTRAAVYRESGVFGKTRMDQLRAAAYLDLLNNISAQDRIASGLLPSQTPDATNADADADTEATTGPADDRFPGGDACPCDQCDGSCRPRDDDTDADDPNGSGTGDDGLDDGFDGGAPGGPDAGPSPGGPGNSHPHRRDPDEGPDNSHPHGPDSDDGGPDDAPGGIGSLGESASDGGPGAGGKACDGNGTGGGLMVGMMGGSTTDAAHPSAVVAGDPPPARQDLVIPLATLLGLADRPGEGHGLGALDPELCRTLAHLAAHSPHTSICLTVTNPHGIAIGHGCAKPAGRANGSDADRGIRAHGGPAPPLTRLPARINLTITTGQLAALADNPGPPGPRGRPSRPGSHPSAARTANANANANANEPGSYAPGGWSLAPSGETCHPGHPGHSDWTLTLPDGRRLTIRLEPVPTYDCDHRHESRAYQPGDRLRHLVQVRDYTCTFPTCNRHARDCDFEHAVPYDQGGRTCACNAVARSRGCHRVKQSPGWNVTQPQPGWHRWETPRGRVYTQGPKRYPV